MCDPRRVQNNSGYTHLCSSAPIDSLSTAFLSLFCSLCSGMFDDGVHVYLIEPLQQTHSIVSYNQNMYCIIQRFYPIHPHHTCKTTSAVPHYISTLAEVPFCPIWRWFKCICCVIFVVVLLHCLHVFVLSSSCGRDNVVEINIKILLRMFIILYWFHCASWYQISTICLYFLDFMLSLHQAQKYTGIF